MQPERQEKARVSQSRTSRNAVAPCRSACTRAWFVVGSSSGRYRRAVCPWAEERRSRISGLLAWPAAKAVRSVRSSARLRPGDRREWVLGESVSDCSQLAGVRRARAPGGTGSADATVGTSGRTCRAGHRAIGSSGGRRSPWTHANLRSRRRSPHNRSSSRGCRTAVSVPCRSQRAS
jgi:hypothetical protein